MPEKARNSVSAPRNIRKGTSSHEDIQTARTGEMPPSLRPSMFAFTIPGEPVPFTRVLRGSQQLRAVRYRAYRELVGWRARAAGAEPFDGAVDVRVGIYVPRPDKRRWDIDNVLKGILDALIGIGYADDKQVTAASVSIYRDPEAEVRVRLLWRNA